ncbi:unnamed protein product [Lactuca virosa]|uniref:Uncharacterized protein n=1 Tax=Lactuca virosa TaxID=75947 RepID=A0AAU9NNF8_9ASTR|nr:unnamed protein product [Lactuca virosa]
MTIRWRFVRPVFIPISLGTKSVLPSPRPDWRITGKKADEPDVAEFISAIAAGNNAQLMVVACAGVAGSTTQGLIVASHETGGRLICMVKVIEELHYSKQALSLDASQVEFVVGNAQTLLSNDYKSTDLVVIDSNVDNHEGILGSIQNERAKSTIVLGYNTFWKDSWVWSRSNSHLLPIGEGLLLMRIVGQSDDGGCKNSGHGGNNGGR